MVKADMGLQLPSERKISLHRLQGVLGSRANFNPEVYMGLIVEWTDSLKIILYSTGNIMLVPKITDQNRESLEHPRSAVPFLQRSVSGFVNLCLDSFQNQ